MNRLFILIILIPTLYFGQPSTDGMAIITHWTVFGEMPAFTIFETQDNELVIIDRTP